MPVTINGIPSGITGPSPSQAGQGIGAQGVTAVPAVFGVAGLNSGVSGPDNIDPLVWNLLFYAAKSDADGDPLINPPILDGATIEPVSVFQFGLQSNGYWVMLVGRHSHPTSFAANLALQYFPTVRYLNFVNSKYIQDLTGLQVPGFFSVGLPSNAQPGEAMFQLVNNLSIAQANSPTLSTTVHELWYLLGYPDSNIQGLDGTLSNAISNSGGTSEVVTVFTAQVGIGQLVKQPGAWVIARLPTLINGNGTPAVDPNLVNDGYMRLVYDVTVRNIVITHFHRVQRLLIIDQSGTVIFNGNAVTGAVSPLIPTQAPQDPNEYTPQGLHFDGATGLVTSSNLATQNTGIISFAGWFNIDPSLSGQLEFSQGSGSKTLPVDAPLPAPAWCHMIGTIDAAANTFFLLINGEPVGNGNSNFIFSSAPTNGTKLYIGTDTQGNFFKGDIADLSIWYDQSFLDHGTVTQKSFAQFVGLFRALNGGTTIQPVNPTLTLFGRNTLRQPFQQGDQVNNLLITRRPDVFLSGPANAALTPQTQFGTTLEGILPLSVVSGALTNSSTNPGKITIVPA